MTATELANASEIAGRGGDHACGGLHERLDQQSGDLAMTARKQPLERLGAGEPARRIGQLERTAITIGRVRSQRRKKESLEAIMEQVDVAHAHGAGRIAVIG